MMLPVEEEEKKVPHAYAVVLLEIIILLCQLHSIWWGACTKDMLETEEALHGILKAYDMMQHRKRYAIYEERSSAPPQ